MKSLDKIEIRPSRENFEFGLWLDGQRQPVEFELPPRRAARIAEIIRELLAQLEIPLPPRPVRSSNPFWFVELPALRAAAQRVEEKSASAQPKLRLVKPA
jgi:hypothetical protein